MLGPFFDVTLNLAVGRGQEAQATSQWRPCVRDLTDSRVHDTWTILVAERFFPGAADEASAIELEAAASSVHLGLCARLVSPWIGHAALTGRWLAPSAEQLLWVPSGTTTFELATEGECGEYLDPVEWADAVLDAITPVLLRGGWVRSRTMAVGNLTSAISSAVKTVARTKPTRTSVALTLGETLVAQLASQSPTSGSVFDGDLGAESFRRRSCCLYYRLLPAGTPKPSAVCGDCVLRA